MKEAVRRNKTWSVTVISEDMSSVRVFIYIRLSDRDLVSWVTVEKGKARNKIY